ncbi:hypothetical protein [Frankia sp. R82]|uniref:hypothetical protein n=1 Tax=Frankia sp. R82 TaxID=2950553 RepID=UPI002044CCBF|nr:hypothetical protein [Frankia sp. R82]MCM3886766.1 hypothetical protein [Frankia sp. R82]
MHDAVPLHGGLQAHDAIEGYDDIRGHDDLRAYGAVQAYERTQEFDRALAVADSAIYHAGVGQADRLSADPVDGPIGVLAPPAQARGHALVRASAHTECLLDATPHTMLRVRVRWLQLTTRADDDPVDASGSDRPPWLADVRGGAVGRGPAATRRTAYIPHEVEERVPLWVLLAARPPAPSAPDARWSRGWLPHPSAPRPDPWEPREPRMRAVGGRGDEAGRTHAVRLTAPAGRHARPVLRAGAPPIRVAWDSWAVQGELRLSAGLTDGPHPLVRLRADLVNTSGWHPRLDDAAPWPAWHGADEGPTGSGWHERTLRHALIGAHVIVGVDDGGFVPTDAPRVRTMHAARTGVDDGLWPVLVGEAPTPTAVLLSPVRLGDDRYGPDHPAGAATEHDPT